MQVYNVKGKTLLDNRFRFFVVDDESTDSQGASPEFIAGVVQYLRNKYRCDVYIEDFNHLGKVKIISEMRKECE